ncbi:hypothetical protein FA95DRAFT_1489493 [Auriscalpium vulgare]|uniref:Uncharacterized protein n=1 Tax=Auriscalpium vulgare TaxID=40419 RepID=A0ACB8RZD3_9AGAM|nr:hypothetical protein FA95DRAFT_1489493 [Auriscalpium vulgare]
MVTLNVQTDLDIANGVRGIIYAIILSEDEPEHTSSRRVTLQYPPAYILVKLDRTRVPKLHGLPEHVVPIVPAQKTFQITLPDRRTGKTRTSTVQRRQLPVTAAYAFTDYRSQGQTIPYVIVDIASPPVGSDLSLFNIYVALSRSSGRDTIRLLRDFNEQLFFQAQDQYLTLEDERLRQLNGETKQWWEFEKAHM